MRTIYKPLFTVFLVLLAFSSCQKDLSKDVAALNSFLSENFQKNTKILAQYQEEYQIRAEEKIDFRNAQLETLYKKYTALSAKIKKQITSQNTKVKAIQNVYDELLQEMETIVQKNADYTIDQILTTNTTAQLDTACYLQIMQNNLLIAMTYAFEYTNKPPSTKQHDIAAVKQVAITVQQRLNRVRFTFSSPVLQRVKNDMYVFVNQMLLNGSKITKNATIHKNEASANIILDSLENGNYSIQGNLVLHEKEKTFKIPFQQKFEVR